MENTPRRPVLTLVTASSTRAKAAVVWKEDVEKRIGRTEAHLAVSAESIDAAEGMLSEAQERLIYTWNRLASL